VADSLKDLADELDGLEPSDFDGLTTILSGIIRDNKQVLFGGNGYSEEWHAEAERRGLKNLRTTPDALPEVLADETVAAFENYEVMSKRELQSRYDVWLEQYAIRANIEAETAQAIAKTMILPAALRYLAVINESGVAEGVGGEVREHLEAMGKALLALEQANQYDEELEGLDLAIHTRDHQLAAMADVRDAADKLETVVADDLWPLPKYGEMLFIK
jgi:glutamine synthetase